MSATPNLSPALQQLANDYITWRLDDTPEFATLAGIYDHDHRLDDMSLQAYQDRRDRCQDFLDRAKLLDDKLTHHADMVNLRILKADLQYFLDGFPFKGFLMPLCYLWGVHMNFELLISWMVFKTAEDYRKLLSRMEKLPVQMKQTQELMKEGVKQGIVSHLSSLVGVSEGLKKFVVDVAEESPLWKYFETFPDGIQQKDVDDIQARARILITDQLSTAFKEMEKFIDDYKAATRPKLAVTSLPNGDALYRQYVRFHTTTNMTPEEIHQLGKVEVARIEKEMTKIIHQLGYDMSVSEFSTMIRNDAKFYYDNPEDLLQEIRRLVHDVIAPRLSRIFTAVPKTQLRVVPDPSPEGTLAFLQAASLDGSRPGLYKVNTQLCDSMPKYDLVTLSLHEGIPGHHLQFAYLLESPTMPLFRKVFEDRNYQQAPSRFPFYTAFLEGWALYAEKLGFDMNLFDDPYDRYGHYSNEMYRACRLVVDTGLHCFGWTQEEAVAYMMRYTALGAANIENEVVRYIALPGQALAYKIGQLKISELREKANSALGENFSLKEFHDVVLNAAGPLDFLEDEEARGMVQQVSKMVNNSESRPRHCKDLLDSGDSGSGLRLVYPYPGRPHHRITVYCDHTVDGGGWTVFQRRSNETIRQDFYRTWVEYQLGFGDLEGEFWLGLDLLHELTATTLQQLRIDLEDYEGAHRWAKYGFFHVEAPDTKYRLSVGRYSGDALDAMARHHKSKFSTHDADHDIQSSENCAEKYRGGWWYNNCHDANLNGYQYVGQHSSFANGINWRQWRGYNCSLRRVSMMIRPAF